MEVEAFLRRPLVARIATSDTRVTPVWFLWEEDSFWWLTGPWSDLAERLAEDDRVGLTIDTCDLMTGEVLQVCARGRAVVGELDLARARRKLTRYLGPDEDSWDPRFQLAGAPGWRMVQLEPEYLAARDLSFEPSSAHAHLAQI